MKTKNQINKYNKVLVSVLCLSLIQLAPKSVFAEGTDGGGGGNYNLNYELDRQHYYSQLKWDLHLIDYHVAAFFEAFKPNSLDYWPDNYSPSRLSLPLDKEVINLLYNGKPNIFEVIKQTKVLFKNHDGCSIVDSESNDAYAHRNHPLFGPHICLDEAAITKNYKTFNAKSFLIALLAHEYSHLVGEKGLTEQQAKSLQNFAAKILERLPSVSLYSHGFVGAVHSYMFKQELSSYLDYLDEIQKKAVNPLALKSQICSFDKINKITMLKREVEADINSIIFFSRNLGVFVKYFEDTEILSFLIAREKWDNIASSICGKEGIYDGIILRNPFAPDVDVVAENECSTPVTAMPILDYVKAKYKSYKFGKEVDSMREVPHELNLPRVGFIALNVYTSNLDSLPNEKNLFQNTQIRNLVAKPFSNQTVELIRTELKESIDLLTKYGP